MNGSVRFKSILRCAVGLALALAVSCSGGGGGKPKGTPLALEISPAAVMLRTSSSTVQVKVTGITSRRRKINLTASSEGTTYSSSDTSVADVTIEGAVSARGPGMATLTVTNGTLSATALVYSDWAPAITEGDFDLVGGDGPVTVGQTFAVPMILSVGSKTFGSYRARLTFDPSHFEYVKVFDGTDLGRPLAVRSDTAGEIEVLDTHSPALGQAPTGTIETVRVVLRAIGSRGDASQITGVALEVFDDDFPARPIGPTVPRPFVTGVRWFAIQ